MFNDKVDQAVREYAHAVETYGQPVWYANVDIRTQALVPLDVRRDILANAKVSDGWAYQDGCYFKGRIDARQTLITWAKANVFAIMTIADIAKDADVPESAVRSMVKDRPDIIRKSDGRTYEVRDPHVDRRLEKAG
jgi:hypothetical protein